MNLSELRHELDEITRIFLSAKYYEQDFNYLGALKTKYPNVYKTYYFFFERIFHAITVAMILELNKLFDNREKYSFIKLKYKLTNNYKNSEIKEYLTKSEIDSIFSSLDNEDIENIMQKVKSTRDKYYAHFDRNRTSFNSIKMNSTVTTKLISIAENILQSLELKIFKKTVNYNLTKGELGYKIFDRLDDWEKYREKYGLIRFVD